uniref:InsA N-terminal domain-containing protein n=1 Tax=Candidatus Kentrum sp. FM TaxID=2126340 RepID=A0A450RXU3_9GAMM|nr:MAG: InsA N-terminal domain-containing protein [Candidatus Kentron sp. FM]VFJ48068.1 MAG: InsA N-terminal domain-containing protein [Candidatus Kentron sp. FM]VFK06401.1 MAG: InsA N-terminal domain-containing protein [Candidatus Kentron sp. FM]
MVLQPVKCPNCGSINVIRHGNASNGKQRYSCKNKCCERVTFIQDYSDKGRLPIGANLTKLDRYIMLIFMK